MVKGIIYRYESPSGKSYVGQTTNEKRRRECFFNGSYYSGTRFDNAIRKYGVSNFKYEVLFSQDFDSKEKAISVLNEKESYYINMYDSYRNGYNMTLGGEGVRGYSWDSESKIKMIHSLIEYYKNHEERRIAISERAKLRVGEKNAFFGKKHTNETKKLMSKYAHLRTGNKNPFFGKKHSDDSKKKVSLANGKPVLQIDPKTDKVIRKFGSTHEAAKFLGYERANSEIVKVCNGYVSPSGRHYITCKGYKWKYA